MTQLLDTYLAWTELTHHTACARTQWTVDIRTEDDAFRGRHSGPAHACPNEDCDHTDRYERTTIRIVCTSCGVARLLTGDMESERATSTLALGYGRPPRKLGGLFLYPGEPLLYGWGNAEDDDPTGYLVTRSRVDRVQTADVIGTIGQTRGPRRGIQWAATAVPSEDGPYGYGLIRWAQAEEGLRSVAAAAKWISTRDATPAGGESA